MAILPTSTQPTVHAHKSKRKLLLPPSPVEEPVEKKVCPNSLRAASPTCVSNPEHSLLARLLKDTVAQCTYGKDLEKLLEPWHQFEVSANEDGDLLLRNYKDPVCGTPPFKGECSELACAVGTYFQRHPLLSRNYHIVAAEGPCDDYFANGNHVLLLLWPKQDTENIRTHLTQSPEAVPPDCFLVDPSFKRVLLPGEGMPERQRYHLEKIRPLSSLQPNTVSRYANPSVVPVHRCLPVGFVDEVMPEVNDDYSPPLPPEALLFWSADSGFHPDEKPQVDFKIAWSPNASRMFAATHEVSALPQTHLLQQFCARVKEGLAVAWEQHINMALQKRQHLKSRAELLGLVPPSASISQPPTPLAISAAPTPTLTPLPSLQGVLTSSLPDTPFLDDEDALVNKRRG